MKIHDYDGWRLKRQSDGLFHDHFGSTGLSQSKWTYDSFNDIIDAIVKMRVKFHDMSKETCQEHTIRKMGFRSRLSGEVGMIWSFSVFGECKSTKIPFVCEYGLTSKWDSEDLTELMERE
nr:hypothetical protein [Tanacetum cinerariifolium]